MVLVFTAQSKGGVKKAILWGKDGDTLRPLKFYAALRKYDVEHKL